MASKNWEVSVLEEFRQLRTKGKLCDMTLISGDSTQFAVHSTLLSAASPVIMQLVLSGNSTLSFPDIPNDVMRILLDLVYCGEIHYLKAHMENFNHSAFTKSASLLDLHDILKCELDRWLLNVKDIVVKTEKEDDLATIIKDPIQEKEITVTKEEQMTEVENTNFATTKDENLAEKEAGSTEIKKEMTEVKNHLMVSSTKTEPTLEVMPNLNDKAEKQEDVPQPKMLEGLSVIHVDQENEDNCIFHKANSPNKYSKSEQMDEPNSFEKILGNSTAKRKISQNEQIDLVTDHKNTPKKARISKEKSVANINTEESSSDEPDEKMDGDKGQDVIKNGVTSELQASETSTYFPPEDRLDKNAERVLTFETESNHKKSYDTLDMSIKAESTDNDQSDILIRANESRSIGKAPFTAPDRIGNPEKSSVIDSQCDGEESLYSPKKIHTIPRDVIRKLKMLEKRSKVKQKREARGRHNVMVIQDNTSNPVRKEDLVIKCMACGLQCLAAFVKCLLCLERLPREEMRSHISLEHPFYTHITCWMSCCYRHSSAVTGDIKRRVIAKKIYTDTDSDALERSTVFQCSLCDFREEVAHGMKDHLMSVHNISKFFMCDICHDVFKNPGTKREHKHYCSGGEPMQCDQCFKLLDGPKSLCAHIRSEHPDMKKPVEVMRKPCSIRRESSGEKTISCIKCEDVCSTKFVKCMLCSTDLSRDTLKNHMQSCHPYSPTNIFLYKCKESQDTVNNKVDHKDSKTSHVIGRWLRDSMAVDKTSESATKARFQCFSCSQECTGITTFGKHCRFEHQIKIVFVCKVCKDVFRTASVRDKHYKYCVYGHDNASVEKKRGHDETASSTSLLPMALLKYSSIVTPSIINNIPAIEYGVINENTMQKSRCLRCAKNLHNCMSKVLKCFLCQQHIAAECLDEHMSQQHSHLQGSQCFTCGISKSTRDTLVLGFNSIIDKSLKNIGAEADIEMAVDLSTVGITCLYCGEQFVEFQDFVEHCSGQHQVTEMHYCNKCPMIFSTKLSQADHEFFCDMGGSPHCKTCMMLFPSPQMLKKHERDQHSSRAEESVATVKCPYCDSYEEQGISRYRVHLRTVHNHEKIFICKMCFRAFDQVYKKDLHEHEAHASKVTVCSECGKDFSTPVKLQRHISYWHRGGKHKEMVRRNQLSEKLCQYCGKGFKMLANLRDHVNRYHLQFKPHKCGYCDKRFYHTFAKQKHEFKDHAAGYYQCNFCTHKSYSNWDLKKHMERVHGASHLEQSDQMETNLETITSDNSVTESGQMMQEPPMYILEGDFIQAVAQPGASGTDDGIMDSVRKGKVTELSYSTETMAVSALTPNIVYQVQDDKGQLYDVQGLEHEGAGVNVLTVEQAPRCEERGRGSDGEEMVILPNN